MQEFGGSGQGHPHATQYGVFPDVAKPDEKVLVLDRRAQQAILLNVRSQDVEEIHELRLNVRSQDEIHELRGYHDCLRSASRDFLAAPAECVSPRRAAPEEKFPGHEQTALSFQSQYSEKPASLHAAATENFILLDICKGSEHARIVRPLMKKTEVLALLATPTVVVLVTRGEGGLVLTVWSAKNIHIGGTGEHVKFAL